VVADLAANLVACNFSGLWFLLAEETHGYYPC
jgi:hypothetical protein